MSVETYVGVPGVAVNVESEQDVYEALDAMHTQVMDNLSENKALLDFLSKVMDEMTEKFEDVL